MATYVLYGRNLSPAEAKGILEALLTLQFQVRDSNYQGGEYFHAGNRDGENFELKKNMDPYDGDPVEMKFPNFPTLLYINATSRPDTLKKILGQARSGFTLLRHEDF